MQKNPTKYNEIYETNIYNICLDKQTYSYMNIWNKYQHLVNIKNINSPYSTIYNMI